MDKNLYNKAFLSIDIAFALVIMSLAFIVVLHIQNEISKDISTNDIQKLQEANNNLLSNIVQNKCYKDIIISKNHNYNICRFEGKKDYIIFQYIKVL